MNSFFKPKIFLFFLLINFSNLAQAFIWPQSIWIFKPTYSAMPIRTGSDPVKLCNQGASDYNEFVSASGFNDMLPITSSVSRSWDDYPVGCRFYLRNGNVWHDRDLDVDRSQSVCPSDSISAGNGTCECRAGFWENKKKTICLRAKEKSHMCMAASFGNPISAATGEKIASEVDIEGLGVDSLNFSRFYSSGAFDNLAAFGMPKNWTHSYAIGLRLYPWGLTPYQNIYAETGPVAKIIIRDDIKLFSGDAQGQNWIAEYGADTLSRDPSGNWIFQDASDNSILKFSGDGLLMKKVRPNGWQTNFQYNTSGQLLLVSNEFGQSLAFAYNSKGFLDKITKNDGRQFSYRYDNIDNLIGVTFSDGSSRTYLYENNIFPGALTGVLNADGSRYSTFSYDATGRAVSTEHADGSFRYVISYHDNSSAVVTDPLGNSRNYSFSAKSGNLTVTSSSDVSYDGRSEASNRVLSNSGLVASETDFNGVKSLFDWDEIRQLRLSVTHAVGKLEERVRKTQWHSTWALPTLITEPGRTTAYTYDTQGRPLSRTVTHTAAGDKTQTTTWTYNTNSLIATETAPNGAVTSYTYDTSGNVLSAINALGHVTSYAYDSANRVISQTAPNGLVTTYTWDARDRLLTQVVGSQQTTTLSYTPFGAIATLTLPTALSISYTYDPAHRLTGWSNNRGESGSFTLDGMGNRTAEQIRDSAGAVAWTMSRTINSINRVASQTEGGSQTRTFSYDANGERVRETNGLNQSTQYGLDSLRRVKTMTDAANASANLKYDALDAVTEATDFKGVVTNFTRDAQGHATAEVGTDIGARSTTYDALGLPSQIVDALGQATTIQRDALGRPTQLGFADGKFTTLHYDLTGGAYNAAGAPNASIGYLSEIQDRSGSTVYQRDAFGRVVRKTQTLISGVAGAGSYSYTAAGLLDTMTYPGGPDHVLQHVYDATGRLTAMNWRGQPLITGITWNPLGQPTGWTWAFGAVSGLNGVNLTTTRSYDTAGRLVNVATGGQTVLGYTYDAAGRVNSLSQLLAEPVTPGDPGSALTTALRNWVAGYDATGRLISFNRSGTATPVDTAAFAYDANGNRTTSSRVVDGVTTNRTYGITGNRLTDFSQSLNGTSTSVPYTYNANRDLTSDGLHTYTYDAEGRLSTATTGATDASPTTRYAHNALGQRVFKTEPQYPPAEGDENDAGFMQSLMNFFARLWNPSTAQTEILGYVYAYDEEAVSSANTAWAAPTARASSSMSTCPRPRGRCPSW